MRPEENRDAGKKRGALVFSVATAVFLTVFKLGVGLAAHSLAVLASAFDSLMDVLVSVVNLIAIKEADKPADSEHRYGHGKIESLAGLFQSLLITVSGLYLLFEAVRRLIKGSTLDHLTLAIVVMVVSMALTLLLVLKLRRIRKETNSLILKAETLHYTVDFLTNGGVIVALVLVRVTGSSLWDLVVAFGIACYILKSAAVILKNSIDELLDRAIPQAEQKEIVRIVLDYDPKIVGIHNFRTRRIGQKRFIDFHYEIRGEKDFSRAHRMTEELVTKIQERFPGSDVTIHYDPEGED
jgi:ferrous-iron efflux pump FieF